MLKYNPSPAREHERERDNILLLPTLAWGGCIRQFSPSAAFAFLAAIQHDRAVAGLTTGLLASIGLILAGPTVTGIDSPETNHHLIHARPWYPLENPGIPSVPLSSGAAVEGTLLSGQSAPRRSLMNCRSAPKLDPGR